MSSNGAQNDQWLTAGTKKSDQASINKDGANGTYITEGGHRSRELPGKQDNKDDTDVEMEESSPKDGKADSSNLVGQCDTKLNTVPGHSTKENNVNEETGYHVTINVDAHATINSDMGSTHGAENSVSGDKESERGAGNSVSGEKESERGAGTGAAGVLDQKNETGSRSMLLLTRQTTERAESKQETSLEGAGKNAQEAKTGWREVHNGRKFKFKSDQGQQKSGTKQSEETAENLNLNVGCINLRFMCSEGFNVTGGLRAFITAGQAYDTQFSIMALSGDGQDIMWAADVPTTREGIESYYSRHSGSNNVAGRMKIRTAYPIGQLKQQTISFKPYLLKSKVHINNTQLGGKEGITLGWIWKSHPAFSYRTDLKERMHEMLKDLAPRMKYALFPKAISYQRQSDVKRVSTNAIAIQVLKQKDVSPGKLRQAIAERWEKLMANSGGCLYSKSFIPFGKECGMDDSTMNYLIQEQNIFLNTTKQRIANNLNDIDEIMEVELKYRKNDGMDDTEMTLREKLWLS
jgi:hypothetical protein